MERVGLSLPLVFGRLVFVILNFLFLFVYDTFLFLSCVLLFSCNLVLCHGKRLKILHCGVTSFGFLDGSQYRG